MGRKGKGYGSHKQKKGLFQEGHLPLGKDRVSVGRGFIKQMTSLGLIRKFQTDWFQPLPEEAKTAIWLGIKSWFVGVGFGTSDSILACCSFFK